MESTSSSEPVMQALFFDPSFPSSHQGTHVLWFQLQPRQLKTKPAFVSPCTPTTCAGADPPSGCTTVGAFAGKPTTGSAGCARYSGADGCRARGASTSASSACSTIQLMAGSRPQLCVSMSAFSERARGKPCKRKLRSGRLQENHHVQQLY